MNDIDELRSTISELEEKKKRLKIKISTGINSEENRDKFLESVGENIAYHRNKQGLTQQELSEIVGLSRTSIANIEKGRQDPGISKIWMIANALQVFIGVLFKGTFNPLKS